MFVMLCDIVEVVVFPVDVHENVSESHEFLRNSVQILCKVTLNVHFSIYIV
jgi:hypothetical protein